MRIAPGGSAIPGRAIAALLHPGDPRSDLVRDLQARFPARRFSFHASGREAMRVVVGHLATERGRDEIAIPAYGCFSIPASVVAAGLRVRLIDVDERGCLLPEALRRQRLDRVAAVVVGNLFGLPEPIAPIVDVARAAGIAVIDDAAQALGASEAHTAVGDRADAGILSFGRGKPVSALGGGVAIWRDGAMDRSIPASSSEGLGAPRRIRALLRALAYDCTRRPQVLGLLASIPALGIGQTIYDTHFETGPMPGAAVALASVLLPLLDAQNDDRRQRALSLCERIRMQTGFTPLLEAPGTLGVYPRLALLAPSRSHRDRALTALVRHGATAMYPTPLASIRALQPHLADVAPCPGAEDFCARLLTLPTHAGLVPALTDEVVAVLAAR